MIVDPGAMAARLMHSAALGPIARLEFRLAIDQRTVNVQSTREAFRTLPQAPGAIAYLTPTRVRNFGDTAR